MIEDIIKHLLIDEMKSELAEYDGEKAVFYLADSLHGDSGWSGKRTPRVDFDIDWARTPEGSTAGSMAVNVWCGAEDAVPPEVIGKEIKELLSGLLVTGENNVYAALWIDTAAAHASEGELQMAGATVSFGLAAFPFSQTEARGPDVSLMNYIRNKWDSALVIGIDAMTQIMRITDERPAVYVRPGRSGWQIKPSHAAGWVSVSLLCHVIAPSYAARLRLLKSIAGDLSVYGEITLDDGSPMFIERLSTDELANPLTTGQLSLTCRYGVLRQYPDVPVIEEVNININEGSMVTWR